MRFPLSSAFLISFAHAFASLGCGGTASSAAPPPGDAASPIQPPNPVCPHEAPDGGATTVLAQGEDEPSAIALDATNVYWLVSAQDHPGSGAVMSAPVCGGAVKTLASGAYLPWGIAVDATHVYWVEGTEGGAVKSVPIAGGAVTTLATTDFPVGIAVDETSVYWTSLGPTTTGGVSAGTVMKMHLDGSDPTTLAAVPGSGPESLAIDATNAYWADVDLMAILKVPLAGGAVTTLAQAQVAVGGIAVDAENVYWTNNAGDVMKLALTGGTPTSIASGQSVAGAIALDATSVYWVNSLSEIQSTPLAGGAVTTLAADQNGATGLALGGSNVYWSTRSGGGVYSVPK